MPAPKNLKILKPDDVLQTMFSIRAGLGVRCDFCHNPQDYSSDEKAEKLTARKMLEMVNTANTNTFNGEQKVVCWTCHRGQQKPEAAPPVQMPGRGPGGGGPGGGRGPGAGGPGGGAPAGPPPPAQ
jgi:hypothetical protein